MISFIATLMKKEYISLHLNLNDKLTFTGNLTLQKYLFQILFLTDSLIFKLFVLTCYFLTHNISIITVFWPEGVTDWLMVLHHVSPNSRCCKTVGCASFGLGVLVTFLLWPWSEAVFLFATLWNCLTHQLRIQFKVRDFLYRVTAAPSESTVVQSSWMCCACLCLGFLNFILALF